MGAASAAAISKSNEALDLDQYQGKVVVLDFWASWCVPCRRSFPWMNDMQQKYADDGLVIIAVNLDNDAADAARFLERYPATFLVHYDAERELARQMNVEAMPTSFVLNRSGQIVDRHAGFKAADVSLYESRLVSALEN